MTSTFRPWHEAWHDALYGDDGFYRRHEGPAGHFATSAQGIPGVDAVLANAVLALADRADADVIVDFACGRGELLTSIAELAGEQGPRLVGVDIVERPRDLPRVIEWVRSEGGGYVPAEELASVLADQRALVIAHEWLDVVPTPIAELDGDGHWREVLVASDGEERLGERLNHEVETWIGENRATSMRGSPMPGERVEIGLPRDAAWRELVDAVRQGAEPGSLVIGVDYFVTCETMPPLGTLTGFANGSQTTPIPNGSVDITSHVTVDSLDIDSYVTQRELLFDLFGHAPLDVVPVELARTNPPEYLARLSARSAFAAATARDGLGGFAWWFKQL